MTRLFLVRHGRVAEAWRGRIYGRLDVPLSAAGFADARRAAEILAPAPLAAVVSSGLARADAGAELLRAGRGLPARVEPDLAEIDRGAWAGLTYGELERREPGAWRRWNEDPGRSRPPDGESLADVAARVLPCVVHLAAEHRGKTVAIVAHRWVLRAVLCAALELDLAAAPRIALRPGAVAVVDRPVGDGRAVVAGLDVDELPPR